MNGGSFCSDAAKGSVLENHKENRDILFVVEQLIKKGLSTLEPEHLVPDNEEEVIIERNFHDLTKQELIERCEALNHNLSQLNRMVHLLVGCEENHDSWYAEFFKLRESLKSEEKNAFILNNEENIVPYKLNASG